MRWVALALAAALASGCNYEQMFLRYCEESGACRCTGSDCCAEQGEQCGQLPCCDKRECNASGVCEGEVNLVFDPPQFVLGEVPPGQQQLTVTVTNSGHRVSDPVQMSLGAGTYNVALDSTGCDGKVLRTGDSCQVRLSITPSPPGVLGVRLFATAGARKFWVDFQARWGAGLAITGAMNFGARVVSDPPGVDCPGSCEHRFAPGTPVRLSASPTVGVSYALQAPCDAGLPCALTMNRDFDFRLDVLPWLTVDIAGLTEGRIRILPSNQVCEFPGLNSPVRCQFPISGQIVLRPEFDESKGSGELARRAWTTGPCKGQEPDCSLNLTGPTTVSTEFDLPNQLFLQSVVLGQIGADAAGADAACTPGYVAWVFTSTHDPRPALANARGWCFPSTYGFVRFLDQLPEAVEGRARLPLGSSFLGVDVIVSGLRPDGGLPAASEVCGNFSQTSGTTVAGNKQYGGTRWFHDPLGPQLSCAGTAQVVCLQAKPDLIFVHAPLPSRLAFVSSPWIPLGGVTGADQHCAADASGARLPGTFRALVGRTGGTAGERFASSGMTWATVTQVPVYQGLGPAPFLNIDVRGAVVLSDGVMSSATYLWADGPNDTDADTCRSWNGGSGATGAVRLAEGQGVYSHVPCSTAQRLLCFEDD